MPTPPLQKQEIERRKKVLEECLAEGFAPFGQTGGQGSAVNEAARRLRVHPATLGHSVRLGAVAPDWTKYAPSARATIAAEVAPPPPMPARQDLSEALLKALRSGPLSLAEISHRVGSTPGQALDELQALQSRAHNIRKIGDDYALEREMEPAFVRGPSFRYVSRPDNTFYFGVAADSHLGSKYERLDALVDIYDRFAKAKVDRVFHCGNWVEGEASFNRTDVAIHGMEQQLQYCVKHYPRREGIVTYAVTGDDHEGWYAQREGIDIGRRLEQDMRDAGRSDWVNLGYMEAYVELVNANTGKVAVLAVVHPGGGSAYADSYVVQKIIESLDGGEKPAVALYGHYHKMLAGEYRNVFWVLVPSTKDQDVFMRKKRIRSVVGGGIITLEQDPETGAITGFTPKLWRYFNKSFYNNRWSHSGGVELPEREAL